MNYQPFSFEKVIEVFEETGVPEHLWLSAWDSVEAGYNAANSSKAIFANLSAPLVVPIALLGTDWSSEKLPDMFHLWDNDTSLNGDRNIPVPLDPDSELAISGCYYNEGHHPREWMSRYKWIGLRNRGKGAFMIPVTDDSMKHGELVWGTQGLTRGDPENPPKTGWMVTNVGTYWQVIGVHELGVGGFYHEPKWGWKTGLSQALDDQFGTGKMMAVGINLKFRRTKK